ncbi:hypothetical protein Micbo1qcDRAFT_166634 [Microdochium bolleyi]|uniref:Uncharacterized protein n=1 Tax=Microdochium bolleyi TaxID=196109 RepID=A0A136IUA7_9PEZI|nr:hypothetical protein Micbo1qcDRAFT_166634 [Microdochium bolleyi]
MSSWPSPTLPLPISSFLAVRFVSTGTLLSLSPFCTLLLATTTFASPTPVPRRYSFSGSRFQFSFCTTLLA